MPPHSGSFLLPSSFLSSTPILPQGLCTCWNTSPDLHRAVSFSSVRLGSGLSSEKPSLTPLQGCPLAPACPLPHLSCFSVEHWPAPALILCFFSFLSFCALLSPRWSPEQRRTLCRSAADL